MQALTSYQHAHDAAGERASNRDDAIDAATRSIIMSKAELVEQIERMIEQDDMQPAELIAFLFASRMPEQIRPEWFAPSIAEYVARNMQLNVYAALSKEAQSRVDAESSNEQ